MQTERLGDSCSRTLSHAPSPSVGVDDSALVQYPLQTGGPVVLTKSSRPAEVKMWLENKDFSRM